MEDGLSEVVEFLPQVRVLMLQNADLGLELGFYIVNCAVGDFLYKGFLPRDRPRVFVVAYFWHFQGRQNALFFLHYHLISMLYFRVD